MNTFQTLNNANTERALIAGLLVNPGERDLVRSIVRVEDLHFHGYRRIYEAMLRAPSIDVLSIEEELRRMGINADTLCDENGQVIRLTDLFNESITGLNVQDHARYLADYAIRRRLVASAGVFAKDAFDLNLKIDTVVERGIQSLMRASAHHWRNVPELPEIADTWCTGFLESLSRAGQLPGIATKIQPLDAHLQGLRPGKLITVAARPGVGKSALMTQLALKSASAGHSTLVASLEMGEPEIFGRMVANYTGIGVRPAANHLLSDDQRASVLAAVDRIKQLPLSIVYGSGLTLARLIGECERIVARRGSLELIVVDYVQLMRGEQQRKQQTRDAEISEITRGLKEIAGRFNACVLVGSQLNRGGANGEPGLEHMRESGGVENDSDAVLVMWALCEPNLILPEGHNAIGAAIKKNRDGSTGRFEMLLNGTLQRLGVFERR